MYIKLKKKKKCQRYNFNTTLHPKHQKIDLCWSSPTWVQIFLLYLFTVFSLWGKTIFIHKKCTVEVNGRVSKHAFILSSSLYSRLNIEI